MQGAGHSIQMMMVWVTIAESFYDLPECIEYRGFNLSVHS